MECARELAERGRYTAAPNPLVGAVVVCDGEIVGEGWHVRAGETHAEVRALESCGGVARGATMYSTLEPCNYHGRTPPCTEAIVRAGISRVVVGHLDPNPRMRGKSLEILENSGVGVEVAPYEYLGRQNEQFLHYMSTGLPFVHLKLAATLDGRIAAHTGESKWITGDDSRHRGHLLRAEAGAVLVGARTARTDDPLLTARDVEGEPPPITRAVLDPSLTVREESNLVRNVGENPLVVFTSEENAEGKRAERLREDGVEVVAVPLFEGELDLVSVLEELGDREVRGVLVEGGGETAAGFIRRGLVQKATLFYAPRMLGSEAVAAVGELAVERVADSPRFAVECVEWSGEDVAVTLYPKEGKEEYVYRAG